MTGFSLHRQAGAPRYYLVYPFLLTSFSLFTLEGQAEKRGDWEREVYVKCEGVGSFWSQALSWISLTSYENA